MKTLNQDFLFIHWKTPRAVKRDPESIRLHYLEKKVNAGNWRCIEWNWMVRKPGISNHRKLQLSSKFCQHSLLITFIQNFTDMGIRKTLLGVSFLAQRKEQRKGEEIFQETETLKCEKPLRLSTYVTFFPIFFFFPSYLPPFFLPFLFLSLFFILHSKIILVWLSFFTLF